MWKIVLQSGFHGIKPAPKALKHADGSYTIKLSPAHFELFKENQRKQCVGVGVPVKRKVKKLPPANIPAEVRPEEVGPSVSDVDDKVGYTKDPSMLFFGFNENDFSYFFVISSSLRYRFDKCNFLVSFFITLNEPDIFQGGNFILQISAPLWYTIKNNDGFKGIKPTPNPDPNPDGSFTVKLTPSQFAIFQENQKDQSVAPHKKPSDNSVSVIKDASALSLKYSVIL